MSAPSVKIPELVAKLKVTTGGDFGEARRACSELIGILMNGYYEENARVLARAGGAAAAMHLMEQRPKDIIIQRCGCMILSSSFDDRCKKEIQERGGIPLLLAALDTFMDDEVVRTTALSALLFLVSFAPSAVLDGVAVLLRVMKHHLEDTTSLMVVSEILARLTSKKYRGTRAACDNGMVLVNEGCIPILATCLGHLAAQPAETQDKNLDLCVLRAFTSLLGAHGEPRALEFVEHDDSLRFHAILDIMRRWNDCIDIQCHVCQMLALCFKDASQQDTAAAIVEGDGVELVIKAIKLFLGTTSINEQSLLLHLGYAVLALSEIYCTLNGVESLNALRMAQGLPVIVEVMQEPFPNVKRQSKGHLHTLSINVLRFCFNMFLEKNHKDRVRDFISEMLACGAVPTILMSMRQFEDIVSIQSNACSLLAATAEIGERGAEALVVNDGRQIIERAMMHHEDDGNIQKHGNKVLELLYGIDEIDRCHACLASTEDLMHCSRCMQVFYCSKQCQKKDYKLHKKLCKQMASEVNSDVS